MAKYKTTFDAVYSGMLLELNLGTNTGKSNMSGSVTQSNVQTNPAGVQGGVNMKFTDNPKFAQPVTTVPGTTTQQSAINNPQKQKQGIQTKNVASNPTAAQIDPKEMEEFANLLSLRETDRIRFNKDMQELSKNPKRFSGFIDFVAQQIK